MAERFEIQATTGAVHGGRLPSFNAYRLGPGVPVDPRLLTSGSPYIPCFFDQATSQLVFAELPPTIDLRQAAFAFVELHRQARALLAVSEEELHAAAARCPPGLPPIFIFNTSRCGSTLLHRAFNQVPQVSSLGELSFVDDLRRLAEDPSQRPRVIELMRSAYRIMMTRYGETVSFKQLAPCTSIADLHHAAFPTASCLFLYRNAMDWAASWQRFREANGIHDVDMQMWLQAMDAYVSCQTSGTPLTAIRYEEFNHRPEAILVALFERLRLPVDAVQAAMEVFAEDAQAGTELARVDGHPNAYRLTEAQRQSVTRQLARHEPPWPPAPLVDGTLSV
ncbi:MAG: sulfotransferase [Planctomycetota bacterium]